MEIVLISIGYKDTCIPWKNNPIGNLICGVECNMKYVLEKKMVNVFSICPLQTVLEF